MFRYLPYEMRMTKLVQLKDNFVLQRKKVDIDLGLPDIKYHNHDIKLVKDSQQKSDYTELLNTPDDSVLRKIMRLRQCINDPNLMDFVSDRKAFNEYTMNLKNEDAELVIKCLHLCKIMSNIPKSDKLIIFTQWRSSQVLLESVLSSNRMENIGEILSYHGGLTLVEKKEILDKFEKSNTTRVLLITINSGGVGLNLVSANHAIIFEPCWTNAIERQAIDRVYRIGQKKMVNIHRLRVVNSTEDWIGCVKHYKHNLETQIMESNLDLDKLDSLWKERNESFSKNVSCKEDSNEKSADD